MTTTIGLITLILTELTVSSQSFACLKDPEGIRSQCAFQDDLFLSQQQKRLSDSSDSSLLHHFYGCRSGSDNDELICDGPDIDEVPSVDALPKNVSIFRLNGTSITTLKNHSLFGMRIVHLLIHNNDLLTSLELDAFVGIQGLKELSIVDNKKFSFSNLPFFQQDFYHPFESLRDLQFLVLRGNKIDLENTSSMSSNYDTGPCLQVLDLSSNPIGRIDADFFRAFGCGHIKSLILRNVGLRSIHKDAFRWISGLEDLHLSDNAELFEYENTDLVSAISNLQNLTSVNLDRNAIKIIPFDLIQSVNTSLEYLNLSLNIFTNLGVGDFPYMDNVKTLILDTCRIDSIEEDTFSHLISLEYLSLKFNTFHQFPQMNFWSNLKSLHFQGIGQDPEIFLPLENLFINYESLEELSLTYLTLGNLNFNKFNGLTSLSVLRLEHSRISKIEIGTLDALPNLKHLLMGSCEGLDKIPLDILRGPRSLEVLDLSYVHIFSDNIDRMNQHPVSQNEEDFPLAHARILNLTSSLINVENPMDILSLSNMTDLEVLQIGENSIRQWNKTRFDKNPNLTHLIMNKNHDYFALTPAMIEDFKKLRYIDMSHNKFDCNDEIRSFVIMMNQSKNSENVPTVKDWDGGNGYTCKDYDGAKYTFLEYTFKGMDIDSSFPGDDPNTSANQISWSVYGIVIGCSILIILFGVSTYLVHTNRWYFQYLIAKRKAGNIRKTVEPVFDAFVSYSSEDEVWVHSHLVPNLETSEPEGEIPLQLCLHERDFKLGQPIAENIVASLEDSRACILVLTQAYAKSTWCNFEAEVARYMFHEQKRSEHLIVVLPGDIPSSHLNKTLRYILKKRTYLEWKDDRETIFWKRLRKILQNPGSKFFQQPTVSVIDVPPSNEIIVEESEL